MIKFRHLFRAFVPCLLLAAAPLLSNCGEAAGFGTETGNPPQLQEKKLYLELVADGIRVVGEPGAIAPPGASVRIRNVTSGASVEATAAADGSLDVVIAGDGGDELELTVTSGGQEASGRVSLGGVGRRTDLSGVSCVALEATLSQTVVDVMADADVACSADVDCVVAGHAAAAACYYQCGTSVVSRAGLAAASAEGQQLTAAVCAELGRCERPPASSCPPFPVIPACIAGRCEAVDPSTLSCDDFMQSAGARRRQLGAEANKECVADADCALADVSVPCILQCDSALESVAVSAVAGLEAAVRDQVDSRYCSPFSARGCLADDLSCPAPLTPREAFCDAGACGVRFVE